MRQDADMAAETDTMGLIHRLWLIPAGAEIRAVPVWELATPVDPPGDLGSPHAYWRKAGTTTPSSGV